MSIFKLFKNIRPFVKKYRGYVYFTLLLTLIGSLLAQVNAFVMKYTVDRIAELLPHADKMKTGMHLLTVISIILIAKEILNSFVTFGQNFFGEKLKIFISKDLAQTIIDKMLTYRLAFFSSGNNESGKLQTRIDRSIDSLTRLIKNFFIDIIPLFATAIVSLFLMFRANFYIGLVGTTLIPIYFFVAQKQAQKLSGWRRTMRGYREQKSQGIISIIESISVIKSFNREDLESSKQLKIQNDVTDNQLQTRKIGFFYDNLQSFIDQIGIVIIIILTTYLVLDNKLSIGAILFHVTLYRNVSSPIRQLQRIYDDMNDALIYSESYFEILKMDHMDEFAGKYIPEKLTGRFEMKNVDFSYPNGNKVLHDVNLQIEPDTSTALVGLSGAGKSTIINLLTKFYVPQKGVITLDGVDLLQYDTTYLRSQIGLVFQKNHIFNGTIEENIRYGKPEATDAEVMNAAKKAYIHDQIMQLPEQYKTRALNLSGGQQQRIAIARVFLKDPPILFLDEPTASLDAIATEQIKNSLDAIKKDRTVIIISHSLSQIIDADYVYAIKEGHIIEHGTHQEVYHQNGVYKEIFDASARSLNIEKISKTID